MAGDPDLADVGRLSRRDVEENIDLLGRRIGSAFGGDSRAVVAVLLHELADVLQGVVEFVERMKFAEFELRGIHDLVVVGMAGSSFDIDGSDKEIKRCIEDETHIRAGRGNFRLDVGKASGGKEDADALANPVAIKRLAGFLRKHLQQVVAVRHTWQVDGLNGTSGVSGDGGKT